MEKLMYLTWLGAESTRSDVAEVMLGRVGEELLALDPVALTVDVWIDRSGCARRVVVTIPLAAQAGAGPLDRLGPDAMMRIQGDFYGFGAPVRVDAPPGSQVRPYSSLRIAPPAG